MKVFSHIEAVLGWFGLVAAFCLAERRSPRSATLLQSYSGWRH